MPGLLLRVSGKRLQIPESFPFPFQPYDIQVDFMKKLYETIELEKIGIFESPTGTVGTAQISI